MVPGKRYCANCGNSRIYFTNEVVTCFNCNTTGGGWTYDPPPKPKKPKKQNEAKPMRLAEVKTTKKSQKQRPRKRKRRYGN